MALSVLTCSPLASGRRPRTRSARCGRQSSSSTAWIRRAPRGKVRGCRRSFSVRWAPPATATARRKPSCWDCRANAGNGRHLHRRRPGCRAAARRRIADRGTPPRGLRLRRRPGPAPAQIPPGPPERHDFPGTRRHRGGAARTHLLLDRRRLRGRRAMRPERPIVADDTLLPYPFTTGTSSWRSAHGRTCPFHDVMLANELAWRSEAEIRDRLLQSGRSCANASTTAARGRSACREA